MSADRREKRPEYTVEESCALLDFLLRSVKGLSRNSVKSLLTRGQVLVDGRAVTRHDHPLAPGQTVKITRAGAAETPPIIYEDAELVVIDKSAGLLAVATDAEKQKTAYRMLTDHVRESGGGRIFVVHRLDRDTSGVLLFAKNERIKRALQDDWNSIVTERGYTAVVEGRPDEKRGVMRSWLRETKTHLVYCSATPGDGLEAVTRYEVTAWGPAYSLLDIRLETGRKNQIRAQLRELGHPVAGDKKYGAATDPAKRLCLHAHTLALTHPFTGEELRFEAPTPGSFAALVRG